MARRLLIVDDEAKLLRAVAATLREEGYDVATARSGSDALVQINSSSPQDPCMRIGSGNTTGRTKG